MSVRAVVAVGLTLAALTSCAAWPGESASGPRLGGPLEPPTLEGGFAAYRPPHLSTFTVTFGAFPLCLSNDGEPVRLTAVRPQHVGDAPFTAFVHMVTPQAVAAVAPSERPHFSAWGAGKGSPPDFAEPYAHGRVGGTHTSTIDGVTVRTTCDQTREATAAVDDRRIPDHATTDMEIVISAGTRGAEVNGVVIDYTAGGKKYRRTVPWRMVVCDVAGRRHNCTEPEAR